MRTCGGSANEELCHMVSIVLAYEVHDYALELVEAAQGEQLINTTMAEDYKSAIKGSMMGLKAFALRGTLALCIAGLAGIPLSLFGRRGRNLASGLIRAQAAPLFRGLFRAASRGGLEASMIYDS